MAELVERAAELRPEDCRRSAERFSPHRVAAGYEAAYAGALERASSGVRA
jgi:hypothetical protein